MPDELKNRERFEALIEQLIKGQLVGEERRELAGLLDQPVYAELLQERFKEDLATGRYVNTDQDELFEKILARIEANVHRNINRKPAPVHRIHFLKRLGWAAAAAILIIAGFGIFQYLNKKQAVPTSFASNIHVPAPDKSKAIIVLNNGDSINLDQIKGGQFITKEGLVITKTADGQITYSGEANVTAAIYNTAINPKGSTKMHVGLPDGTEIWLNAGSSITYPLSFKEQMRKVKLNGEAYLQVAHDANHPFVVEKNSTSVTVLGTHFNVKAYDNETAIKVTLLEGSVRVQKDNAIQLLKPNQQAVVNANNIELIEDADTQEAMAWYNGRTSFHDIGLAEALKELERWYNVTITTEQGATLPVKQLYIDMDRSRSLQDVLKSILEDNGVKYGYDEATRTVTIK